MMKSFKKRMALVLAGVLALCILTGCGTSINMLKALNKTGAAKFVEMTGVPAERKAALIRQTKDAIEKEAGKGTNKDSTVEDVIEKLIRSRLRDNYTADGTNEEIFAIVEVGERSFQQQAEQAVKNVKKCTATSNQKTSVESYTLTAGKTYEVLDCLVKTDTKGTWRILVFHESSAAQG